MIDIRDENALPISITLIKKVQDQYSLQMMNASMQFKTAIDKNESIEQQVFDYLKSKEVFTGLVDIIITKFSRDALLRLMNHEPYQNYSELSKEFQKTEEKILSLSVWIKNETIIEALEDC